MTWPPLSESAKCQVTIKGGGYNMPHTIKMDMNGRLVSFLPTWKVKNHLIYVPGCQNNLHVLIFENTGTVNRLMQHTHLHGDSHTLLHSAGWLNVITAESLSVAEGQPVIYWRVLTLKCMMAVNRLAIISRAVQTDGCQGNTTDSTGGFHVSEQSCFGLRTMNTESMPSSPQA